jgi:hypothetical protein
MGTDWGRGGCGWNHGKDGRHGRKTGSVGGLMLIFSTTDEHQGKQFGKRAIAGADRSGIGKPRWGWLALEFPHLNPVQSYRSVDATLLGEMTYGNSQ